MTETAPPRPRSRLYLITPPVISDVPAFAQSLDAALNAGDVACLQLRLKQGDVIDEAATRTVSAAITEMAQERGVAVLINDSAELAQDLGADGVHLGLDDGSIKAARELLGPDAIIGATAKNSRHQAMLAGEQGADYVAFGAFFSTDTKADTAQADPALLTLWQETMELPCVAIGGINAENAGVLVQAGADFIAVSGAIWSHPDDAAAGVAELNAVFDALDPAR